MSNTSLDYNYILDYNYLLYIQRERKMKKSVKAVLILLVILTVIYVSAVVYASANSSVDTDSSGEGKHPTEYGIWRHYHTWKLQGEPQEWYTPEELGVILVPSPVIEDHYYLFIVDPEKALPWMSGTEPMPYALKYEDKFHSISFLWLTPALPESIKNWQIPVGGALGACWIFTGAIFLKERKNENV